MWRRLSLPYPLLLLFLLTATSFGQPPDRSANDWEEVNFAFGQSVLTDGFPSLLRLAELLKQHPGYRVHLQGHADHVGPDNDNMELGRRRAEAVRDFLVKYGAQTNEITVESHGERRPAGDNELGEGRWMNRRVQITVTNEKGEVVSDQGVGAAIVSVGASPANTPAGCCDEILTEMKKIDEILTVLTGLKDELARLWKERQTLREDVGHLKQAQRELKTEVATAPKPVTETQVREIVRTATRGDALDGGVTETRVREIVRTESSSNPKPSSKFSRYNLMAGPDTQDGRLTVGAQGQVFLPFGERHAVQAQGDFMHSFQRDEGQFDLGIVNRFGPVQAGIFSSFKYVKFDEFSHGGALGQVSGTLDYIFPQGRVGLFGARGLMDGSVLNSRILGTNRMEETYLSIVDQLGITAALAAWGDSWFEGNVGLQYRRLDGNTAGGRLRYVHPLSDHLAFTVAGGLNETLISTGNMGSFTVGLEFGQWLTPKNYAETRGPVPVDVPRIRYEVLTRTVRTGNGVPVADAGPDQVGVEADTILLDGSGSFDPDQDPLTFAWEQIGGPAVALSSSTAVQTSFMADAGQTYHFRLTVKDSYDGVDTDRVTVSTVDPEITILRFTAEPLRITAGESATLVWGVRNATEAQISGIGAVDPEGGSMTVNPIETTTYTLTARNSSREASQTVTVTVDPKITIDRFTVEPLRIIAGESATLVWGVRNATEAQISGIGAVDPQGGSMTVSPTETTTYTLTARNSSREASQTVTVTVDPEVSILRFTAEPLRITAGESATLVWGVRNATEARISGIGAVDPRGGHMTVSPAETTTYTLTARNSEREASQTVTVTVDPVPPPPPSDPVDPPIIVNFVVAPKRINRGQECRLRWEVRNATDVTISQIGPVSPRGTILVKPEQTVTYTLTARNKMGETMAVASVAVNQ